VAEGQIVKRRERCDRGIDMAVEPLLYCFPEETDRGRRPPRIRATLSTFDGLKNVAENGRRTLKLRNCASACIATQGNSWILIWKIS